MEWKAIIEEDNGKTKKGTDFEKKVADIFTRMGFQTQHNCLIGGNQIDVFVVQEKRSGKKINTISANAKGGSQTSAWMLKPSR